MRPILLTAIYSSFMTISVIALIGLLAPPFVIHWFGGVTRQEFADFAEHTPGGRAPVHIWQGTDGSDDVRYLGSVDASFPLTLLAQPKMSIGISASFTNDRNAFRSH